MELIGPHAAIISSADATIVNQCQQVLIYCLRRGTVHAVSGDWVAPDLLRVIQSQQPYLYSITCGGMQSEKANMVDMCSRMDLGHWAALALLLLEG